MTNVFAKIAVITVLSSLFVSTSFAVGSKEGSRPGLLKKVFNVQTKAALGTCTLTNIDGTTLTCTKNSDTYTILTDDKTQFRRKFWGKSSLSELTVNDVINVIGVWTDDTKSSVQARLIRNTSIQLRFGVFIGNVTELTASGWIMNTVKRGNQEVAVESETKIMNRREEEISKTDVTVGHRVRVKGLWNSTANTITEVSHVKNFSLPVKPSATPTP